MKKTWRKVTATVAVVMLGYGGFGAAKLLTAAPVDHPLADRYGVTVKMVDGFLPCGLTPNAHGCFVHIDPDSIYIRSDTTKQKFDFLVAHEIRHVLQYRAGEPQDECAADVFANEYVPQEAGGYDC